MIVNKRSVQRELLLEILRGTKTHPDADWIYQKAREKMPKISLGTVYRNLAKLADDGVISRIRISGRTEHFDGNICSHYHFVCGKCGKICDIDAEYNPDFDNMITDDVGSVEGHSLMFYGVCSECKNSDTKEK